MKGTERERQVGGLLVLLLTAVFAVCVLSVLLTGAEIYERLVRRGERNYDSRTGIQYVASRVRRADRMGAVSVGSVGGQDALFLSEEIGGAVYETVIYFGDGYIRELFVEEGYDLQPEDGEKLLRAEALRVSPAGPDGRSISVGVLSGDGQWEEVTLRLRSGEVLLS